VVMQAQGKPWMSIDLGMRYEVEKVTITAAPANSGAPVYNASHTFTLRVGDVQSKPNATTPDDGLDRR
jgi:hypothetical protein